MKVGKLDVNGTAVKTHEGWFCSRKLVLVHLQNLLIMPPSQLHGTFQSYHNGDIV